MDDSQLIGIIGMAGRFPGADSVEELWRMLKSGGSAISVPSDAELLSLGVRPELLANPRYVRARMRFDGADLFDPGFFGYSARQAQMLDPQQRLFLECAWEALESAGYDTQGFQGAVGVFAGCGTNVYLLNRTRLASCDLPSWRRSEWHDMLLEADKDHIATRVSFKLGLTGPSFGVQTTCSSSLVAIHVACQSLLRGECDIALAGGVSLVACQRPPGYLYVRDGINSPDGYCRAFDANAAGTAWGSGVGIVVLRRYEDAVAEGDCVCALIEGSAINNDGAAKMGYTAPSVRGQQEVIALAQAVAGVAPGDIDMIEAHGTGTALGDAIELEALQGVFGSDSRNRQAPCVLGSIKTNIGHLDIASGVTGLIKAALCLQNECFVPSLNFSAPNPALSIEGCALHVNTACRGWPAQPGRLRRAGVSSMGFGGTNAHVLLREAPVRESAGKTCGLQLFPLSARDPSALTRVRVRLATWLRNHSDVNLADLAFTLQLGRRRFRCRQTIIADGLEELLAALQSPDREPVPLGSGRTDSMLVFAFGPGDEEENSPLDRLILDYGVAQSWIRRGVVPHITVGYGAGAYAAACVAGVLTVDEATRVLMKTQPEVRDASTVAVYGMDCVLERGESAPRWRDIVCNSDCMILQLGCGLLWGQLLERERPEGKRPVVISSTPGLEVQDTRHVLQTMAQMWVHGVRVDWKQLHAGEPRTRIPLPTYPFNRASYWLPIPENEREPESPASSHSAATQRFFVPSWRVDLQGEDLGADVAAGGECWLVMADCAAGAQIMQQLELQGHLPVLVQPGTSFVELEERRFSISPECPADYSKLLATLRLRGWVPRRIAHCWTVANGSGTDCPETFLQQQPRGYFSLLFLAKALAAQTQPYRCSMLVVTRCTYRIAEHDRCNPANSTIPALCKVMAQELPHLSCTVLDLSATAGDVSGSSELTSEDVERVVAEAARAWTPPAVAYRDGLRLTDSIEPLELITDGTPLRELRERGVYVITGGLGKLGLAVATWLARRCRARLLLLTRGAFPPRARWDEAALEAQPATLERLRSLREIEALGSEVMVRECDARRPEQLEAAFTEAENRFGAIAGVFHLAADMTHRSVNRALTDLTPEDVEAQWGPKIHGWYALDTVLRTRDPDFGVLFSSNSSILGGLGFAAYAAANSFLDHCATSNALERRFQWIGINWDRWVLDQAHAKEPYVMGMEEGLDALESILRHCTAPRVIVAAALDERRHRWVLQRRKSAPQPACVPVARRVPPRTELERTILQVWQEVLGCGEIGVEDSFLELGGDSLIGLRILGRLRELFQLEIPLKALLGPRPTVASLVLQLVEELQHTQAASEAQLANAS